MIFLNNPYMESVLVGPSDSGKTAIYKIMSKSKDVKLGEVSWYAAWRQYCFFPSPNCTFNQACLSDLSDFLFALMNERGALRARQKAQTAFYRKYHEDPDRMMADLMLKRG